jgi:hypothetical protein
MYAPAVSQIVCAARYLATPTVNPKESARFSDRQQILSDRQNKFADHQQLLYACKKFLSHVCIFCPNVAIDTLLLLEKIAYSQQKLADSHPHDNRAGLCFTLCHHNHSEWKLFSPPGYHVFSPNSRLFQMHGRTFWDPPI